MAESDIFVSNDIALDVDFGEIFVIDQGVIYKVIAKKYSSEKTYAVGDYVSHLERLYRCITAVETAEAFDEEKWTEVFLADEVQIANNNIALKANAADVYAKTDTYNKTEVNEALAEKVDSDDLAAVATSGDYSDLSNTPNLATVATSGSYDDLTDKPTIPAAQVNSDWNSDSGVSKILNKPNLAAVATSGDYSDLSNAPALATVATSGDYNDLSNTPAIPDELSELLDTTITSPANGDVLKYDSASSKWVNGQGGGGGASALDDLTDVDITTPTEGDTLVYDSTNSKWVNGAGGGSAKQTAVTQAQYDALVQAGTVDPTMEYFITDGIPYQVTPWTELIATLTAGSTTLVFTSSAITTNSTIDVYVDDSFYGVNPISVTLATGSVTLGFYEQATDIPVKVRIS